MAKTAANTTVPAIRLAIRQPITAEISRQVLEQQNSAIVSRPVVLFAFYGARPGSYSGGPPGLSLTFNAGLNTWETRIRTAVKIPNEVATVRCSVMPFLTAGHTAEVRFTLGAATALTLSLTDAHNGTRQTGTIDVTGIVGTSVIAATVEMRRTSSDTLGYLRSGVVQWEPVSVTALPDPDGS